MITFVGGGRDDRFRRRGPAGRGTHVDGNERGRHALGDMLVSDKLSHARRGRAVLGVDGGDDPGRMVRRRRNPTRIAPPCRSGGRHAVLCRRGGLEHGKLTSRIRIVYCGVSRRRTIDPFFHGSIKRVCSSE